MDYFYHFMKPSTQPLENKTNRQATTPIRLNKKIGRVSRTTHHAILAAFASFAMSSCCNTDEIIVPQATSAPERDLAVDQGMQEFEREEERVLLYEQQKKEEIEIRLSTARRENTNLTEIDLRNLESQFGYEIDIARIYITLEPRLLLLNRRGTTPELKELANETLKKLSEIVDLTGEDGSGITAPLNIMDESAIHHLDIKESELNSDISLMTSINLELYNLHMIYNNWKRDKGLIDLNTWLNKGPYDEEILKLFEKWESLYNNHPFVRRYENRFNLGPATPEASPEQR